MATGATVAEVTGEGIRGGVDGGASGSRALLLDPGDAILARASGPPAAVDGAAPEEAARLVAELIRDAAGKAGIRPPLAGLCAGLAGAGTGELREAVAGRLREEGVARAVRVVSDVEAARHDAFGAGPGIVVLAGTGAVSAGVGPDGSRARADGWGPAAGDEGSGLDLARRGLRAALRAHDGRGPPTRLAEALVRESGRRDLPALARWSASADRRSLAALAPAVFRAAGEGDRVAERILAEGAASLAVAVRAVRERLAPWPGRAPVAAGGGLIAPDGPYRRALARSLAGHPVELLADAPDPPRGAARMAPGTE